jgi:hypothetical protein
MIIALSEHTVKRTRKDHRCFGCCRMIPKDSEAHVSNNSEDGKAYTLYMHPACNEVLKNIESDYFYDNEIPEGFVREYLNDIGFKGTPEEYVANGGEGSYAS